MVDSNKEKYDVVDIDDKVQFTVVGKKSLHGMMPGLCHRSVHLFLDVVGGRFVIQLKGEDTENAGKLSSAVSGHVLSGETYEQAVIRETKEELGIDIDTNELAKIATINPCEETGNEFIGLYTYLLDDKSERIKPNPDEIKEIRILKLDDVIKDMDDNPDKYSPAFVVCMNIFLTVYKS